MSSQASSSGHDEARVRRKLVESGAVDVMMDIRGNFFYTRTVPCQLWFLDRSKELDLARVDQVLMLDVRSIYRKVSRAIFDFSPEQQKNIASIIWLHRGRPDRFLALLHSYLSEAVSGSLSSKTPLAGFLDALKRLTGLLSPFVDIKRDIDPLAESWKQLTLAAEALNADVLLFGESADSNAADWSHKTANNLPDNPAVHEMRKSLHPLADQCRDLVKQVDLAAKLAGHVEDTAIKELAARDSDLWPNADITKSRKALERARAEAVRALRQPRYFVKQADWLQERFPDGELRNVEGLVKLVNRAEIASKDWSLTPGRYVGVAPEEIDEDFDFEEVLRSIHIDLKSLNEEATELGAQIMRNFEELGA